MKVILTDDVYKHGVVGEVVEVADGFARNYLIPRGLAIKATPGTLKQAEALRAQAKVRRAQLEQEFGEVAARIEEMTLFFPVKAGESGKLYGSVTPADIVARLNEQLGLEIDRRRVGERPLRELGEHYVAVRLSAGLAPRVRVVIHREGETPEETLAEVAEMQAEAEQAEAEEPLPEVELAEQAEAEEPLPEVEPADQTEAEEPLPEAETADEADLEAES
jgi:large subunit ribosomal protein L9